MEVSLRRYSIGSSAAPARPTARSANPPDGQQKAERRTARQHGKGFDLGLRQPTCRGVTLEQRRAASEIEHSLGVEAPGIEADRDVGRPRRRCRRSRSRSARTAGRPGRRRCRGRDRRGSRPRAGRAASATTGRRVRGEIVPGETGRDRVRTRFGRGEQHRPCIDRECVGAAQGEIGTAAVEFGQGTAESRNNGLPRDP